MPDDQPTRRLRLHFSLRQLFLAVALVAICLGIWDWVFRKEVIVSAPRADEVAFDDNHVAFEVCLPKDPRIVAFLTGRFHQGMLVFISLWRVESGIVQETSDGGHLLVTDKMGSIWISRTIPLVLGEERIDGENVATLGFVWEDQNRSGWATLPWHDINVVAKKTLPCRIREGSSRIVYVEGDQKIIVNGTMTLDEFAKVNPGRYLVVTVQL